MLAPGEPFTLEFPAGKLGMKIKKVDDVTIVKKIVKDGMADMLAEGTVKDIKVGDEIVEIAGQSIAGMATSDIKALLKTADRPMKVVFQHKVKEGEMETFAAKLIAKKEKAGEKEEDGAAAGEDRKKEEEEEGGGGKEPKEKEEKPKEEEGTAGVKKAGADTIVNIAPEPSKTQAAEAGVEKTTTKKKKDGSIGELKVDGSRTFLDRFKMLFSFSGEKTQPKRIGKRKRRKLYRLRPAAPADALATLNQLWGRLLKRGDLAMAQQTLNDLDTKVKDLKRVPSTLNLGLKKKTRKRGTRSKSKSPRGALGASGAKKMIKGKKKTKARGIEDIYNDSGYRSTEREEADATIPLLTHIHTCAQSPQWTALVWRGRSKGWPREWLDSGERREGKHGSLFLHSLSQIRCSRGVVPAIMMKGRRSSTNPR